MPDSEVFVSMKLPLRECTACAWSGVILSNSPPQSGMYYLEFEPVDGPDRCAFCPECGQPLKVRNSG
jgi:hypothetical protein